MRLQLAGEGIHAAHGLDSPAQCQHIAPMAVAMKQAPEHAIVARAERLLELRKPMVGGRREGLGSGRHLHLPSYIPLARTRERLSLDYGRASRCMKSTVCRRAH